MDGWIIWDKSQTCQLTKYLFWYRRDIETEGYGYVFSEQELTHIKTSCKSWDIQPSYKQKAHWDGKQVTLTGYLERF